MAEPLTTTIGSVLLQDAHEHKDRPQEANENAISNAFANSEDQIEEATKLPNGSTQSAAEELEGLKAQVAALAARLDKMDGANKAEAQSGVAEDVKSETRTDNGESKKDASEDEDVKASKKKEDKPELLRLEIKRLSMDIWHSSLDLKREEASENVLIVYRKTLTRRGLGAQEDIDAGPQDGWSDDRVQHIPQRLQINSNPLLDVLETICGTLLPDAPCVMVPPFKAIVGSQEKMQQVLESKEAAIRKFQQQKEGNSATIGLASMEQTTIEKELEYEKTATKHLRCLLQFIEEDLKEILELRSKIKDGTLKKITFSNLWHLFTPGDVIFANSDILGRSIKRLSYPRAFILCSVVGGRPGLRRKPSKKQKNFALAVGIEDGSRAPDETQEGSSKPFKLDLYSMAYDGDCLTPDSEIPSIDEYRGEKNITDLDYYPARFSPHYDEVREQLIERGKRYVRCLKDCFNEYSGLTMGDEPEEVDGEVVTDAKTGYFTNGDSVEFEVYHYSSSRRKADNDEWLEPYSGACSDPECETCTYNYNDDKFEAHRFDGFQPLKSIDPGDSTQMSGITDDHYLLLPKNILGFVLRIRKWKYLDVDLIQKPREIVEGGKTPFEELVIEEEYKKTILALIQSHSAGPNSLKRRIQQGESVSMDLVKGKGRGLVILLHGAPGVGKTSTAETVAAHTKRPLYPITCGDLGTTATAVETALERHFKLAHRWGCVLLLDEADVFLARRQEGDVQRNALVSVFLRTLEYYSGILILTTNRVGEIDEAFHSRIKMSFYYQPLNEDRTMQIWKNSLDKIKETTKRNKEAGIVVKIDNDERNEILAFARSNFLENFKDKKKQPWNGRQIRNAFQTSLALADYDRLDELERKIKKGKITLDDIEAKSKYRTVRLKVKHFRQVATVTADYHKYVTVVQQGKTNETLAALRQLRANDSDLETPSGKRAIRRAEPPSKAKPATNKAKKARRPMPDSESGTASEKEVVEEDDGDDKAEDDDDDGNDDSESSYESDD